MVLLLIIVLAAAALASWLAPWAGIGFVINGSVVYYAALHLFDFAPSAQLTGAVLAVAGGVAAVRLVTRPGATARIAHNASFYLFMVFALIWYARWLMDPPPATGFGARALAYMVVLAIVPFVSGLLIWKSELRVALWWVLGFGVAGVAVMLAYWITAAPTLSTNFSGRWEPIPYLVGGLIAVDLGVACLSLFALFPTSRIAAVLGCLLAFLVFAVDIRLGSRGPFLFLIACLASYIVILIPRAGMRTAAVRAAGLAVALLVAFRIASPAAEVAPPPAPSSSVSAGSPVGEPPLATNAPPRVAQAEGYLSTQDPATRARFETLEAALDFIAEKPVFGWGGELVGRDINGHPWDYAHNTLLDPLVETGVVGAVPYWTLFVLEALWMVGAFRRKLPIAGSILPLLPLFAFAFVESLVSGHVAISRHLWLFVGIASSLLTRTGDVDMPVVASSAERGAATTRA